jgi:hypothetical protein
MEGTGQVYTVKNLEKVDSGKDKCFLVVKGGAFMFARQRINFELDDSIEGVVATVADKTDTETAICLHGRLNNLNNLLSQVGLRIKEEETATLQR